MPYKNREDLYRAQKKHRLKVRSELFKYLSTKACVDCGENDPVVLEFDHKGHSGKSKIKFKSISDMLSGHYSWLSVNNEITKCEIRCANCHRRKTYVQFSHFGRTRPFAEKIKKDSL